MYSAIGVEPTKLIASIFRLSSSASTASLSPCTTLKTPSGSPASLSSRAISIDADGSFSLGLSTKVLPHASATGNIHSGTIAGKVERRDAGDDAERLAHRIAVDAGADLLGVFALQQLRNAGRELDHLEAALHLALRVRQHLPVLAGDDGGQLGLIALEQLAESVEDASPAQRRRGRPCGKRGRGRIDRPLDVGHCSRSRPGVSLCRTTGCRRCRSGRRSPPRV